LIIDPGGGTGGAVFAGEIEHPDSSRINKILIARNGITYLCRVPLSIIGMPPIKSDTAFLNCCPNGLCIFTTPFDLTLESRLFCLHVCDNTGGLLSFLLHRDDNLCLCEFVLGVVATAEADHQTNGEGDDGAANAEH